MILHTQHGNGLKARVVLDSEGHMGHGYKTFCVHLYTRDDEYCDSYYAGDLAEAMRAIGPGLRSGNFDRFRAHERYAAMIEADTLDLY